MKPPERRAIPGGAVLTPGQLAPLPHLVALQAQGLAAPGAAPRLWRLVFAIRVSALEGQPGRALIAEIPTGIHARDLAQLFRGLAEQADAIALAADLEAQHNQAHVNDAQTPDTVRPAAIGTPSTGQAGRWPPKGEAQPAPAAAQAPPEPASNTRH